MRKYIRHPSCVPIEIAIAEAQAYASGEPGALVETSAAAVNMLNISAGGLAFNLLHPVQVGAQMVISMPQVWPDYSARGVVVWCREAEQGYEAGVEFNEVDEAFKARMVAQFCQIEDYRRDVREREGRSLSSDEAAREWIVRYAAEFAETLGWQ